jgi:hypothetical protein
LDGEYYSTVVDEAELLDAEIGAFTADVTYWESLVDSLRQMTFPNELRLLLPLCGLKVTEQYGDYDRSPFNRESRQYLWVAATS